MDRHFSPDGPKHRWGIPDYEPSTNSISVEVDTNAVTVTVSE